MGGRSIFRVRAGESNVNVILETLTDGGRNLAMAQRYLPEIVDGDKRILPIDGKPVDYCLARIPQGDEFQIGRAHVCTPVTNAQLVCRLLLEQKNHLIPSSSCT